jgi:hypothetical protein
MKFYFTTEGSWVKDEKRCLYNGEHLDHAKEAIPDAIKAFEVPEDKFPTKYPYLFSTHFKQRSSKIVAFYSRENIWVSIVVTDTEEPNP